MAIFKIFPDKDTTIYPSIPDKNTGLDPILEIQNDKETFETSRILIQFPSSVLEDILNNIEGDYEAYLKLFLADAESLPEDYSLVVNPISQSWDSGVGKFLFEPYDKNGCTWIQRTNEDEWTTSSFSLNTTSSFNISNPGGGSWYYNYEGSQSFGLNNVKDTNINVTDIIKAFASGNIDNNGVMVRMKDIENTLSTSLKYFSKDTHTIYPPQLEIKWDDSSYITGSFGVLGNENTVVTLGNNIGTYDKDTVYRFIVRGRETYPSRNFVTQSVYVSRDKLLPSSSFWAIKDMLSGEFVIDFDDNYTKISCDGNSNYFFIYMNGLQPERLYAVIIKSFFENGSIVVFDNNCVFKINK